MHHPTKGKCARRGAFFALRPMARFRSTAIFSPWASVLFRFAAFPFGFPSLFPLGRQVSSSCFFWGALALLLCALARLVFLLRFFLFRLVRSSAIVGVSVVEKMLLRPLPRVRASCARASRVSNNSLHFFTQCAQPLDMECFAVKANCRVFRFTFLPDGCKALSFSEIR